MLELGCENATVGKNGLTMRIIKSWIFQVTNKWSVEFFTTLVFSRIVQVMIRRILQIYLKVEKNKSYKVKILHFIKSYSENVTRGFDCLM